MKYQRIIISCLFAGLLALISGCGGSSKPGLKVVATSVPHAELLEVVKPDLADKGIDLDIIIVDDFNSPNRSVADGEADANFFQHLPYLEAQEADFGYELEPLAGIHLEPMALYSKKISKLSELKDGASIAVPSDPSNQARALQLLEKAELITLKDKGTKTSVWDVEGNPRRFKFIEMDSPLLSRVLDDVDASVINTNFALLAGLSPKKDALLIEDAQSRYVNYIVVRKGESGRNDLQALKAAMTSEKVRQYIKEHYHDAIVAAF